MKHNINPSLFNSTLNTRNCLITQSENMLHIVKDHVSIYIYDLYLQYNQWFCSRNISVRAGSPASVHLITLEVALRFVGEDNPDACGFSCTQTRYGFSRTMHYFTLKNNLSMERAAAQEEKDLCLNL